MQIRMLKHTSKLLKKGETTHERWSKLKSCYARDRLELYLSQGRMLVKTCKFW